MRASFDLD